MRLLFTFAGGRGHAEPQVPIAHAAERAGHAVAFSGRASVAAELAARGFAVFPDPVVPVDTVREIAPLLEPDAAREDAALREGFADRIARERAERILAVCAEWRPDALVCDEVDFGGMIAAERLGLPHATVVVSAAGGFIRAGVVAAPLDAVREAHGLPADPGLAMLGRYLVLAPAPPGFRDPAFPLPPTALAIRPAALDAASALPHLDDGPVVLLTLGTVFNVESGDLFTRLLAGLRALPVQVVATLGPQLDPADLGPQPANVHVAAHIPQAALLPRCDVVVSHGGSGTVIGALAAGVPSIVLPLGADQPLNAARLEALGAGLALSPTRTTPQRIGAAATAVLGAPAYRAAARRLRDECRALPGPEAAVARLELL